MNRDVTSRFDGTERWRRERLQRWPYGLGAVVLAVVLPVAAGYPDPRAQFTHLRGEMIVAIAATVVASAALLAVASLIRRSLRAAWLGLAALALMLCHPILDASFTHRPHVVAVVRAGLFAAALVARAATLADLSLPGRVVRSSASGLAVVAVVLAAVQDAGDRLVSPSTSLATATAALMVGSFDFIRGQRDTDGAAASLGMTMLSFGFGGLILLASGDIQLTVGAACVSIVTAVCAVAASMVAVFEAVAYRDARLRTMELSEALALTRLRERTEAMAVLTHDQRGALLAIEAAARRLQDRPSQDLAAAVAAEAARLQRVLAATDPQAPTTFDVEAALAPMVACMASIGRGVSLRASPGVEAWGVVDDVVEIVRALVENGIAHGKGHVSVSARRKGDHVVVLVADQGLGVPPALRDSIFGRGVTDVPRSHAGLGLWAAREAATTMGATLVVSPTVPAAFELELRTTPLEEPGPTAPSTTADILPIVGESHG